MADNTNWTGKPDSVLISLTQPYEVRDWSEKFGCTEAQLRACVADTGSHAASKVAKCLKAKGTVDERIVKLGASHGSSLTTSTRSVKDYNKCFSSGESCTGPMDVLRGRDFV